MMNKFKQNAENIQKITEGKMAGELKSLVRHAFEEQIAKQNLEFESVAEFGVEETFINIAKGNLLHEYQITHLEILCLVKSAMERAKGRDLNLARGCPDISNIPGMRQLAEMSGAYAFSAVVENGGTNEEAIECGLALRRYVKIRAGIVDSSKDGNITPTMLQQASDANKNNDSIGLTAYNILLSAFNGGFKIPGMNILSGISELNSMSPEAVGEMMTGLIQEPPGLDELVSDLKLKYGIV